MSYGNYATAGFTFIVNYEKAYVLKVGLTLRIHVSGHVPCPPYAVFNSYHPLKDAVSVCLV
jgi:hypothetical protein